MEKNWQTSFLKLKILKCTFETYKWSVFIFAGNIKTILKPVEPKTKNALYLQFYFFEIKSAFIANNIRLGSNMIRLSFLYIINLRYFSRKVLRNLPRLSTIYRIRSNRISNTNKNIYKIRLLIMNTFHLF